jgi:hypothetical protein
VKCGELGRRYGDGLVQRRKKERRNLELAGLLFCVFEFQVSCVEKCDFVSKLPPPLSPV